MRPDQLAAYATPVQPAISPDGTRVLVTLVRCDPDEDRYHRSLHHWDVDRGLRPFTTGPGDSAPAWSPDGTRIAFQRVVDDRPQVAVIPADGGEATVVTAAATGVRGFAWTSDGSALVVHTTGWADAPDLDPDERARRARRIRRVPFRFDGVGWLHDVEHRLEVVDPAGEEDPRPLTDPLTAVLGFAVLEDRVAFLADTTDRPISDLTTEVWTVPIAGGDPTRLAGLAPWLAVTSDGGDVVVVGSPDVAALPASATPYRLLPDGPVPLVEGLDRSLVVTLGAGVTPVATAAGLVTIHEDGGTVGAVRIAEGTLHEVIGGPRVVTGLAATPDGRSVVATVSSVDHPGRLVLVVDGVETDLGGAALDPPADLALVGADRFAVEGEGGPIDAWVLLPPGDGPVPVLLNIHGGPASQYGDGFFDEFQVYAAAGYGVVACNPRGSSGRGTAWMQAVVGDGWGRDDRADILAVLDTALARHPRLDAERMGIMGGSYGGFMTAWVTASDHRFSSAVVERALLSFPSFFGTSDIGTFFTERYTGGSAMPDDLAALWAKSPLSVAHATTTPTLIIHSEGDYRCPIEQAEQYFVALLAAGVDTEMLRVPGEGHELTRSGGPRHRIERFEAVLGWHGSRLGVATGEVAD